MISMKRIAALKAVFVLAVWCGLPAAHEASAQSADSVGAALPRDSLVSLREITVTALRAPVVLERAPYALTAAPTPLARERTGLSLSDAAFGVPGLQIDNRFNYAQGERVTVRGFGGRAQFGVRGVRILLDGIPMTLPDGQSTLNNIDPGSLARIEVLRGPAAALYGNAAGGVLLLESARPFPGARWGQEAGAVAGAHGLLRTALSAGGEGRRLDYHASFTRLAFDGYRDFNAARNYYGNARVGVRGRRSTGQIVFNAARYDAQNPGSLSDSLLRADRRQAYRNNVLQQTGEEGRQLQAGAGYRRTLGRGFLEAAAYATHRAIDNPIPPRIIDLSRRAGGVRLLRHLEAGRFALTTGLEVEGQQDRRENYANQQGVRGALVLDQEERVAVQSAFARLGARLGGRAYVAGGLRADRFRFRAADFLVGPGNPDDSGRRTLTAWSPTVGFTYEAPRRLNLFANASTAFETPTTTELANQPDGAGGFNQTLAPQRTRSAEAGVRSTRGQTRGAEAAVFAAYTRDALIPFEIPQAPGRQYYRNAGAVERRGVEASVWAAPSEERAYRLAVTWLRVAFRDYRVGAADYAGNALPGIAPLQAHGYALHPLGRFVQGHIGLRYQHRYYVNDANTARTPAYFLADLGLTGRGLRFGRLEALPRLGVSNAFGARYNTSVVINAAGGRYYEPGPGRMWYAGLRLRAEGP